MTVQILVSAHAPPLPTMAGQTAVVRASRPTRDAVDHAQATVVLVTPDWYETDPRLDRELAEVAALLVVGRPGEQAPADDVAHSCSVGWIAADASPALWATTLRGAARHAVALAAANARHDELSELTRIGAALSTERDLTSLLRLILSQARRLASADAGSLYLVERGADGEALSLRFALAQNHTLPDLPFRESTVALDASSLAGYTAVSGRPLVIDDVYELPADVPYRFNRSFDDAVGYRTQSVLVIPMRSHRNEIVGVLQLINRKRSADVTLGTVTAVDQHVIPFDTHVTGLVAAMASQAAVAIENGRLYEDIERLFEGFVTASVHAIEQRDPTTSGHSFRVTAYTMGLADALNRGLGVGPYATTRFTKEQLRELRYACLLHDFGKVAVREAVLQKQKKLHPGDLDVVRHRFGYLLQTLDVAAEREKVDHLLTYGKDGFDAVRQRIEEDRRMRRDALHHMLDTILRANEPSILAEGASEALASLAEQTYVDPMGVQQPLLSAEEVRFLSIPRGNLDARERKEIESHASWSYDFLERIAWTPELRDIPVIVWGHHEKLNGTGYPRGVGAAELGVQTRMMTIADIFDALVASDRPYKRAIPTERAIAILRAEVADGALDGDLVETFVAAEVWVAVADEVRRRSREDRPSTPVRLPSLS
jgi:HD-GYP domain-containing protein (c-di-GMP phosphodiesterase class II)